MASHLLELYYFAVGSLIKTMFLNYWEVLINDFYFCRIIEPLTSRCSKFRFKPLSQDTLEKRLNMICEQENIKCDNKVRQTDLYQRCDVLKNAGTLMMTIIHVILNSLLSAIIPK